MTADNSIITLMVVDDEIDLEPLIRQKFRREIRNNEYDFIFAHNGLEALAKLLEFPEISIILSDINMPEMDGLTLLMRLKELKNPMLKTVIVSAYGDMDNIRTAMNRGAFDFVTKPINFEDLEITIKKTIEEIRILQRSILEHDELMSIQHDLNIAREIQQAILPQVFPPFPHRLDFDIYANMIPAKEVGGDFYDFFLIDSDHLGFVIGDVSGKGVPASIFMAVSRTLIRATGLKYLNPSECIEYANSLLCNESVSCMFVTVFYGILNLKTGEIEYVNAGHNPPYWMQQQGKLEKTAMTGGTILGCFEEFRYSSGKLKLNPGDIFFLYTDGVTEAMNQNNECYLESRLEENLDRFKNLPLTEIIKAVINEVNIFAAGVNQSDDITVMGIKYMG